MNATLKLTETSDNYYTAMTRSPEPRLCERCVLTLILG